MRTAIRRNTHYCYETLDDIEHTIQLIFVG
jgi:hypothetical protein